MLTLKCLVHNDKKKVFIIIILCITYQAILDSFRRLNQDFIIIDFKNNNRQDGS